MAFLGAGQKKLPRQLWKWQSPLCDDVAQQGAGGAHHGDAHQPLGTGVTRPPPARSRVLRGSVGSPHVGMQSPPECPGEWGQGRAGGAAARAPSEPPPGRRCSFRPETPKPRSPKDTIAGAEGRLRCPRTTRSRAPARGRSMVEASGRSCGAWASLNSSQGPAPGSRRRDRPRAGHSVPVSQPPARCLLHLQGSCPRHPHRSPRDCSSRDLGQVRI